MQRRTFLGQAAGVGTVRLAGCLRIDSEQTVEESFSGTDISLASGEQLTRKVELPNEGRVEYTFTVSSDGETGQLSAFVFQRAAFTEDDDPVTSFTTQDSVVDSATGNTSCWELRVCSC